MTVDKSTEHLPVVSRFEIHFDGGDGLVVHGGETLKGNINVELNEKTTLQAVKLQIKGRASWLGDGAAKGEFEKVYFNQDMTLLERPPGRLQSGHFPWAANFLYTLPFECPIPKGCPTSYEGPFGSIRYYVKATLVEEDEHEQRGVTKEHIVKKAFTLLAPSDSSSAHAGDGEPVAVEETAFYGKCCCKGKLSAELSLSKSNFYPGDDVFGSIRVNGKKPKQLLDLVEVRLVDRVLRVGTPEKMGASPYRTLVGKRLEKGEKSPRGDAIDGAYFLTIPAVPPSTKGKFDAETGEVEELALNGLARQFPGVVESPSTATLRFRKQPFLRVQYAVQVALGNVAVLEAPITILELPTTGSAHASLRPFVVGSQPIEESADKGKESFGGPFSYTPVYPVRETSSISIIGGGANGGTAQKSPSSPTSHPAPPTVLVKEERVLETSAQWTSSSPSSPSTVPPAVPAHRTSEASPSPLPASSHPDPSPQATPRSSQIVDSSPSPVPAPSIPSVVQSSPSPAPRSSSPSPSPAVEEVTEERLSRSVEREPSPVVTFPEETTTNNDEEPKTTVHVEEKTEDVLDDDGNVVGKVTTKVTTTETESTIIERSGDEGAVDDVRQRVEQEWGAEGEEGVERIETKTDVTQGEDGEVVTRTTTTKVLRRVKRDAAEGGEEEEEGEASEKE